jgi:hypothetical protein
MDPDNTGPKYSLHFSIFKDGCPEDWINWVMIFCEIENLMPMKEPSDKTRMISNFVEESSLVVL